MKIIRSKPGKNPTKHGILLKGLKPAHKEVLKKYSLEKGVIDSKWNLVTGDKKQIYNLARKSYLVAEDIEESKLFEMIHTENFVLVDPERRIRGFYDGTDQESMNALIYDIKVLKKEISN